MNKQELREKYKKIRLNIQDNNNSHLIFNKIINLKEYRLSKVIGIYYSFSNEVDTKELIDYSIKNNKEVYIPKIKDNHNMDFYKIEKIEDVKTKNKYGILEPLPIKKLNKKLDLLIIPGICFDKNKNRLGFGSGYYDNFLKKEKNIYKIGICYEEQIVDTIPSTTNDIPMDIIVTNKQIYK